MRQSLHAREPGFLQGVALSESLAHDVFISAVRVCILILIVLIQGTCKDRNIELGQNKTSKENKCVLMGLVGCSHSLGLGDLAILL